MSGTVRIDCKQWLSRKQAARYLSEIGCPIAPKTLENLAANNNAGKGPPFMRFRWKCVLYLRVDLERWAAAQSVRVA